MVNLQIKFSKALELFKLPEANINYLKQILDSRPKVLITTHYNPDGDALGSSLALYHFLISNEIQAIILIPNDIPGFLQWMPGTDSLVVYQGNESEGNSLISDAEVIFCLDYNAIHRVNLFENELREAQAIKILVDHHIQPELDFDLMFSEVGVSSTAELLFHILENTSEYAIITKEMAECLFVGIMTDTGSFSYACNNASTFTIVAQLIQAGLDVERVHKMVYDTYSEDRMRLLGLSLSENLKVLPEFATAYIWLTKANLEEYNYQQGDTEGVVNYALSIQNVALAALFTERDDRVRVSLRSKGNFSVNELARKYMNGGGHRNAAGGDIYLPMDEALIMFEKLLPMYASDICKSLELYV